MLDPVDKSDILPSRKDAGDRDVSAWDGGAFSICDIRETPVMDDAQLQTIWQQRRADSRITPLAATLGTFMKHHLGRRVKKLSELAILWDDVIPEKVRRHTALESFRQGVLTVMVDSASHRFELQTLLRGGILKAIQQRFRGALNRIRLVPGQFYTVDLETGRKRYDV
jgi:hypothetical protein